MQKDHETGFIPSPQKNICDGPPLGLYLWAYYENGRGMNELSLFSGAGGGLIASKFMLNFNTVGYVEYDDDCQRVLLQRINDGFLDHAPIFGDIRSFVDYGYARAYQGMVDVITAGFPCQPFSVAGKQMAENDPRNKWPETRDCISIIRPRLALLENVPGLLSKPYIRRVFGAWPKSGIMQDGKLYPRKKRVIATKENDYGLWRTPDSSSGGEISSESLNMMANGNNKRISGHHKQLKLKDQVRHPGLWPTPTLCLNHNRKGLSKNSGDGLATAVKYYPTPTNSMVTIQDLEQARFSGSGGKRPKYGDIYPTPMQRGWRSGKGKTQKERGRSAGPSLSETCQGSLNPDWVEWLMGWPIGWSDLKPLTELRWLDPSIDPHPDIPRTTDVKTNRVNRLKAIGNGQVPLCAAKAWAFLY